MDKLKPILAQKFWIFFGIVLIMPLVGYFMSKGSLAEQIDARWKALDGVFGGIPSGTDSPNETWEQGVNVLNEQRALQNRLANEALWQMQVVKMRWPQDIAAVMKKAEYFKPVPPEAGGIDIPFKYPHDYPRELMRLWEIVDPLDDGKNLRDSDKRRKIAFALADLHQAAGWQSWTEFAPTFDKIWAAQEDIWLQTELLQAIARVNRTAISQGDANIKQMGKITMFGGKKSTGAASAGPGATSSGGEPSYSDATFAFGTMGATGAMGSGGRAEAALTADINLAEEFEVSLEAQGGTRGVMGGFGGGSGSENASATSTAGATTEVQRYIDNDEALPFKRRGFYFKVVMDHRKVPELIAELMNSPFPVEIVRIHQVWYQNPNATSSGSGSPFMATTPGSGASPFSAFPGVESFGVAAEPSSDAADPAAAVFGSGSPMGRPGTSGSGSLAAMADPNLAEVAILGVWTLYRPPAPAADGGQPAPTTPTAAPPPAVTSSPAAPVAPAATTAAPTSTEPATTPTPPARSSEDSSKPSDSEPPAATPQKPAEEKSDSNPVPSSPGDADPKASAIEGTSEKETGTK